MNLSFKKSERISKRDEIELLFKKGKSFIIGPFRILHYPNAENDIPLKLLVSVPKKKIPKAHLRNTIKRRVKEAYRIHRNSLKSALEMRKKSVLLALVYQSEEELDYREIESKISLILERLMETYGQNN